MRRTLVPLVVATLAAPLHAALLGQPCARGACRVARPTIAMCSPPPLRTDAAVDVNSAASDLRKRLDSITLVESFVEATERGDAAAAMRVCTEDFLYKTHRATTDSLAAAEDRLHTKVPAPAKVTQELNEESAGIFVREIVVKPVPFITVAVRQEFEVRATSDGPRLSRAEYIKK